MPPADTRAIDILTADLLNISHGCVLPVFQYIPSVERTLHDHTYSKTHFDS